MKNKNGQQIILASFVAILVIALAAGYFFKPTITGLVVLPEDSECDTIEVAAQYLVVGASTCQGGSEAASCTVRLQNKEAVSITAEPVFACSTSGSETLITASERTLAAEETGDFTISYNNAGSDWTCRIANAKTIKLAEVCN
ncbi:MAG: hypothetical protein AABX93_00635 [Nanoarchaeota archaeon]